MDHWPNLIIGSPPSRSLCTWLELSRLSLCRGLMLVLLETLWISERCSSYAPSIWSSIHLCSSWISRNYPSKKKPTFMKRVEQAEQPFHIIIVHTGGSPWWNLKSKCRCERGIVSVYQSQFYLSILRKRRTDPFFFPHAISKSAPATHNIMLSGQRLSHQRSAPSFQAK
jgi:hypothetical protein